MLERALLLGAAAVTLGGCAISPVPENVTGPENRTSLIAHHVRCEARAAIKRAIVDFLKRRQYFDVAQDIELSVELNELHRKIAGVPRAVQDKIKKYERAAISYDFTFNITERNTTTASVDLINLLSRGSVSMGPSGTADLQRQGTRIFRMTDSFGELIMMQPRRCPAERPAENFVYPITGAIGLDEYVKTFVDLNEFQNLTGPKDKNDVPTIAHTFAFTTTFSGSVGARLTLAPLTNQINIASASLKLDGARIDVHTVIIGLSLEVDKGDPARAPALLGGRPTGTPATAKQRSSDAIDDSIQRSIINRLSAPVF